MKNEILNLEGVQTLSKEQMKSVGGGKKCQSEKLEGVYENDGPGTGTYNGGAVAGLCRVRCRPSFIGIGFGSWSAWEEMPC